MRPHLMRIARKFVRFGQMESKLLKPNAFKPSLPGIYQHNGTIIDFKQLPQEQKKLPINIGKYKIPLVEIEKCIVCVKTDILNTVSASSESEAVYEITYPTATDNTGL